MKNNLKINLLLKIGKYKIYVKMLKFFVFFYLSEFCLKLKKIKFFALFFFCNLLAIFTSWIIILHADPDPGGLPYCGSASTSRKFEC